MNIFRFRVLLFGLVLSRRSEFLYFVSDEFGSDLSSNLPVHVLVNASFPRQVLERRICSRLLRLLRIVLRSSRLLDRFR